MRHGPVSSVSVADVAQQFCLPIADSAFSASDKAVERCESKRTMSTAASVGIIRGGRLLPLPAP